MKKKLKVIMLFLFVLIIFSLTGCRGRKISNDTISYKNINSESIKLTNNINDFVYVDFKIIALDKTGNVLYEGTLKNKRIEKNYLVNLEDMNFDFKDVSTLHVEILQVYAFSHFKVILLTFVIMFFIVFLCSLFIICRKIKES